MENERTRVVCSRDVKQMNMPGMLGGCKRLEEDDNSEEVIGDNFKADA